MFFKFKKPISKNKGFIPYESTLFKMFKFKQHFGQSTRNFHTGFTLVELLVVFFIMASILAVVIPGYLEYSTKLDLENLALDVALTIREAQAYGAGARVSSVTANKFDAIYGVHFDMSSPNSFIFFEDSNADHNYGPGDAVLNMYTMKTGYAIKDLCAQSGGSSYKCAINGVRSLDVFYTRPNPGASIYIRNTTGAQIGGYQDDGEIGIISPDQTVATTSVTLAGGISMR